MNKVKIIIISSIAILLTFVVIQFFVNNNIQDYKIELNVNNPNYESINNKEYWEYIITSKKYDEKYNINVDIYDTMEISNGYLIIDGKNLSYENANRLLRALVNNNIKSEGENSEYFIENYSTIIFNRISPIYLTLLLIIEVIVIIVITTKNKIQIFTKEYWLSSKNEIKNIRKLCLMSIIFACQVVAGMISLPSGFGNLGIGLSYIFQAVNCLLFGPLNGLMLGMFGDLIGYVIAPSPYGFFFGYTLNAMLACFMYGLCFYKTRVTFIKVLISRLFINLFINVILGSVWWGIVSGLSFDQALNTLLFISLPKNLFYLIPQTIVLYLILKSSIKIFYKNNYIEEYQTNISIL